MKLIIIKEIGIYFEVTIHELKFNVYYNDICLTTLNEEVVK